MSDWGFKVSKPGYDASTATDQQLTLSSKLNSIKQLYTGVIQVTGTAEDTVTWISVNAGQLGFAPQWIAYCEDGLGNWRPFNNWALPFAVGAEHDFGIGYSEQIGSFNASLALGVYFELPPGTGSRYVRYYIFADEVE